MEFRLDRHSHLPVVAQLQEQIKAALLVGRLRPGDTLPSIRDVERELGISRNVVRQAYLALKESGILSLQHGKGVVVQKHLDYSHRSATLEKTQRLVQGVLDKSEKLGVVPSAFARFLYQRAIEEETTQPRVVYVDVGEQIAAERAAQISEFWRINVPPVSFDRLAKGNSSGLSRVRKVLTNYMRYDEVRKLVRGRNIEILPLGLVFTERAIAEFSKLPKNSTVLFVFDDADYPRLRLVVDPYKQLLSDPSVQFKTRPMGKVKDLVGLVRSGRYARVVISNRLWERLPKSIRNMRGVIRPELKIDLASLEEARIKAGVIV